MNFLLKKKRLRIDMMLHDTQRDGDISWDSIGEDSTFKNIHRVGTSKDVGMKDKKGKGEVTWSQIVLSWRPAEKMGAFVDQ